MACAVLTARCGSGGRALEIDAASRLWRRVVLLRVNGPSVHQDRVGTTELEVDAEVLARVPLRLGRFLRVCRVATNPGGVARRGFVRGRGSRRLGGRRQLICSSWGAASFALAWPRSRPWAQPRTFPWPRSWQFGQAYSTKCKPDVKRSLTWSNSAVSGVTISNGFCRRCTRHDRRGDTRS